MSRKMTPSSKAGKVAKVATSKARVAVSKTGRVAKTVEVRVVKSVRKAPSVTATTPKRKNASRAAGATKQRRSLTPVQQAAAQGVSTHEENGVMVASTADVLRIARAIAEHRKGLMDRLAK